MAVSIACFAGKAGFVTDEEKQLLLERYMDIVWIDDVTEVKCVRCDRVPIYHYVSNCQHCFCKNCKTVFSDGGKWRCPLCHTYVTELSDQDWQLEEHIYRLRAHCPNKKYGCPYQGQLSTIPGHLRSCKDTREAALPAEFKGITLDTVVNQLMRLNDAMGEMRHEVRDIKDKWKQSETMVHDLTANVKVLTNELNEQKEKLAHEEQIKRDKRLRDAKKFQDLSLKVEQQQILIETKIKEDDNRAVQIDGAMGAMQSEVKEWREKCEINRKHTEDMEIKLDGLMTDVEALTQPFNWQKGQLANVEEALKEVKELRDKCEASCITTDALKADLSEQRIQWAEVEPLLKDVKELKERSVTNWKQVKQNNHEITMDFKLLRWDLHEHKEQLANIKSFLQG